MPTGWQAEGNGVAFSIFEAARPTPPPSPGIYRSEEGTGYPSCSRALARIPRNTNDANGYYAEIGVDPWATDAVVKRACRQAMARHHPDGPEPDAAKFERFKEIAEVLTDPIHRRNYDTVPRGRKLIDSQVLAEMRESGIADDSPGVQQFARTPEDMGADERKGKPRKTERLWDYLATDHHDLDLINAQEWYAHLLAVAPLFRYEATIKVLLHDGRSSAFKKQGGILLIPRTWEPDAGVAFAMLERHVGWPDVTKPRYQHHREEEPEEPNFVVTRTRGWGIGMNGGGGLLAVSHTDVIQE